MTYDDTVHTVVITIEDNDEGGIKVGHTINGDANGKLVFTNVYTNPEDVMININIQKKVDNKSDKKIGLDGFKFVLELGDKKLDVTSNVDGKAAFQLSVGADDIGQTYYFKVYEKKGITAGMTYDKTVYTVKVEALQNPDGSIKPLINNKDTNVIDLEFTNIYQEVTIPVTGDNAPVVMLGSLMLVSGAALIVLMLTKKKKGGKYAA